MNNFTAKEVRDESGWHSGLVADMLAAYADLLEQREAGVMDDETHFKAAFFVSRNGNRIEQLTDAHDYSRGRADIALMDLGQGRASHRALTKKAAGKVVLAWVSDNIAVFPVAAGLLEQRKASVTDDVLDRFDEVYERAWATAIEPRDQTSERIATRIALQSVWPVAAESAQPADSGRVGGTVDARLATASSVNVAAVQEVIRVLRAMAKISPMSYHTRQRLMEQIIKLEAALPESKP